jgi:hypothetical protein
MVFLIASDGINLAVAMVIISAHGKVFFIDFTSILTVIITYLSVVTICLNYFNVDRFVHLIILRNAKHFHRNLILRQTAIHQSVQLSLLPEIIDIIATYDHLSTYKFYQH